MVSLNWVMAIATATRPAQASTTGSTRPDRRRPLNTASATGAPMTSSQMRAWVAK